MGCIKRSWVNVHNPKNVDVIVAPEMNGRAKSRCYGKCLAPQYLYMTMAMVQYVSKNNDRRMSICVLKYGVKPNNANDV